MRPARRGVFQLASHLGMTVRQLEQNMTPGELMEWFEFFRSQQKENEVDLATASPQALGAMFSG